MTNAEHHACPKCGDSCRRDEVHNGLAMLCGPWGCARCGWSEDSRYDLSGGKSPNVLEGIIDQQGGLTAANTTTHQLPLNGGPQDGSNVIIHGPIPTDVWVGRQWMGDGHASWGAWKCERFPVWYRFNFFDWVYRHVSPAEAIRINEPDEVDYEGSGEEWQT